VRVNARPAAPTPRDVAIELVDPVTSPADAVLDGPRDQARPTSRSPRSSPRRSGAPTSRSAAAARRTTAPVKVGFVHHTASSNDYSPEQAAADGARASTPTTCKSNGWSDIGYNFLVDRYGRAYEGRAGGMDRFVVGSHTGGFNRDSFAVSLLGDFSTVPPSQDTLGTLATCWPGSSAPPTATRSPRRCSPRQAAAPRGTAPARRPPSTS
jgi:hypothetical protein